MKSLSKKVTCRQEYISEAGSKVVEPAFLEWVTSSPPESGGVPGGRGGLKKHQFYGMTSEH